MSETLKRGSQCEVELSFTGTLWENAEGLFRGSYPVEKDKNDNFIATYFRPNNARRVFPSFDEPAFKVPFTVRIGRAKSYHTLFNMPLNFTETL